jgi:hypothetical protein
MTDFCAMTPPAEQKLRSQSALSDDFATQNY